jgi:hypothetical protein
VSVSGYSKPVRPYRVMWFILRACYSEREVFPGHKQASNWRHSTNIEGTNSVEVLHVHVLFFLSEEPFPCGRLSDHYGPPVKTAEKIVPTWELLTA